MTINIKFETTMYNGNSMPQITSISTSHLKKAVTIATTSREAILASFDIRPKKQKKMMLKLYFHPLNNGLNQFSSGWILTMVGH